MLTAASVVIDLRRGDDRRRIFAAGLNQAPDGARVIVLVGSRPVDPEALRLLDEACRRQCIEIRAVDFPTCDRWTRALLTGDVIGGAVA